jgi:hypothetical protein
MSVRGEDGGWVVGSYLLATVGCVCVIVGRVEGVTNPRGAVSLMQEQGGGWIWGGSLCVSSATTVSTRLG